MRSLQWGSSYSLGHRQRHRVKNDRSPQTLWRTCTRKLLWSHVTERLNNEGFKHMLHTWKAEQCNANNPCSFHAIDFFKFVYLFWRGSGREGERKSKARSALSTRSLRRGSISWTVTSQPEAEINSELPNWLSRPGAPRVIDCKLKNTNL